MKKSTFSKYVAILLFITMLTLIALAGTYAKYTSSFSGTGAANTSDWYISVNGEEPGTTSFTLTSTEKIYPGADVCLGDIIITNDSSYVSAKVTNIEVTVQDEALSRNLQINLGTMVDVNFGEDIEKIQLGSSAKIPVFATWNYTQDDETNYNNTEITFNITLTVDQTTP